jgi:hypothetical protein
MTGLAAMLIGNWLGNRQRGQQNAQWGSTVNQWNQGQDPYGAWAENTPNAQMQQPGLLDIMSDPVLYQAYIQRQQSATPWWMGRR